MSKTTYELTNHYYGASSPLEVDTSSDTLELYAGDSDSALVWTFDSVQDDKYKICTSYDGTKYCLDIVNTDGAVCPADCTTPHLATPASVTGQQWTLTQEQDDYVKLSNDFTGDGWYLDTYSDTKEAFMSHGDYSGQYWELDVVSQGSASVSLSPSTQTMSSSTDMPPSITTNFSSSSASSIAPLPEASTISSAASHSTSTSGDLSTGAKAGIGAGVGVVALAIIGFLIAIMLRFRKQRQRQQANVPQVTQVAGFPGFNAADSTSFRSQERKVPMYASAELNGRDGERSVHVGELEGRRSGYHPGLSELPTH